MISLKVNDSILNSHMKRLMWEGGLAIYLVYLFVKMLNLIMMNNLKENYFN